MPKLSRKVLGEVDKKVRGLARVIGKYKAAVQNAEQKWMADDGTEVVHSLDKAAMATKIGNRLQALKDLVESITLS